MADETPSLHIDTDWKKQAQEEKRKLAEAEAAKKSQATAPAGQPPVGPGPVPPAGGPAGTPRGRQTREMPAPSFSTLVQSLMTQALYYLGELGGAGGEMLNLDMAKHQIDTLGVLESKTKGNLEPQEQKLLDTALYETRMRFVSVASQMV
jgi:hypothetical protein